MQTCETTEHGVVAVVDDDESIRESLPPLLRSFGFKAVAFASAEGFLSSPLLEQTCCLLLDVAMPGMSGPALYRELERLRRAIPVVFITAQPDDSMRDSLLAMGAVAVLFKPFSDSALRQAVSLAVPP